MAGRINDEDIQALRERADIAVVIGDYTTLKRTGGRLKGLCPFHSEKTPSFTVDPARGFFHCFGCQEGGDVYGFLQKIEALSFPESVERLARIVGYTLQYEEMSPGQRKALGRRTRLTECVAEAEAFYRGLLLSTEGEAARAYLGSRGLGRAEAEHFRIGWAPDRWDALVRHLTGHGFDAEEAVAAGLASQGRQGPIDRFRGRVMFPILDAGGRDVLAFGGRVIPGVDLRTWGNDSSPPKYINSSETEVYKKSRVLYALNWARAEIQRRDTVLVVEGYMDVIGLHMAGVRNAVATCGTALTVEHFQQLEKFARRIILALDADEAGYAAAERAREMAAEVGVREVGVLPLPPGEDPADLAREGEARVEAAFERVQTAVEFQITHLMRGADTSTPEGQVEAYTRTFPLLAKIEDRVLRYRYIRDIVAPAARLSADRIEDEFDAQGAYGVAVAPPPPAAPATTGGRARAVSPQLQVERQILQVALQAPELLPSAWDKVTEDDFTAEASRLLYTAIRAASPGDLDGILSALPDDATRARVRALALAETTMVAESSKAAMLVARLRASAVQRRLDAIHEQLGRMREQLSVDDRRRMLAELAELQARRRDLLEGRDA